MPDSGLASLPPLPLLVLIGILIGFLAGLFGVGGGFLLTPLLNITLGIPYPIAVGTSACQMVGTAAAAFLRYRKLGLGEPRVGWIMLGGSLLGAYLGARGLHALELLGSWRAPGGGAVPVVKLILQPAFTLTLCWIALLVGIELRTNRAAAPQADAVAPGPFLRLRLPPLTDLPVVGLTGVSVPALAYIGLGLGLLSGLLGVGGGILLLPVLLYGLGFPTRHAAATGVLTIGLSVAVATFQHALAGNVDLRLALPLLLGSSTGAQLGAEAAAHLPGRRLRCLLVVLLIGAALALLADLVRQLLA